MQNPESNTTAPIEINTFAKRAQFYWGVSNQETAKAFIAAAAAQGFFNALKDDRFTVFRKYATSERRADFIKKLPLNKDAVVLDMGSGYGNITIPLSKMVKQVYACDSTLELLQFSRARAEAEGCHNINYTHIDPIDYCETPFKEKTFDVILLNGVLEWVGTGDMSRNAGEIQEAVLKYLVSLLKDGGAIYVGIENRFWPLYFYNVKDPHTKRLYTAVVPRFVAHLLMRLHGAKHGYRNYIYSLGGYKRLFGRAGLVVEKLFLPIQSYREPRFMIDAADSAALNALVKDNFGGLYHWKIAAVLKLAHHLGLFKYMSHSFGFILKKESVTSGK